MLVVIGHEVHSLLFDFVHGFGCSLFLFESEKLLEVRLGLFEFEFWQMQDSLEKISDENEILRVFDLHVQEHIPDVVSFGEVGNYVFQISSPGLDIIELVLQHRELGQEQHMASLGNGLETSFEHLFLEHLNEVGDLFPLIRLKFCCNLLLFKQEPDVPDPTVYLALSLFDQQVQILGGFIKFAISLKLTSCAVPAHGR